MDDTPILGHGKTTVAIFATCPKSLTTRTAGPNVEASRSTPKTKRRRELADYAKRTAVNSKGGHGSLFDPPEFIDLLINSLIKRLLGGTVKH